MTMNLREVTEKLNQEHIDNNFKLSELAAKRSINRDGRDWVVVRFHPTENWKDFRAFQPGVELYEAIPVGWPLSNVGERLGMGSELKIIARYNSLTRKWRPASEENY